MFRLTGLIVLALCTVSAIAQSRAPGASGNANAFEWSRFRGPNGSGISTASNIPTEFGPTSNLLWRKEMPQGFSSPILWGDRIYLTGFRGDELMTLAINRATGETIWTRMAPQVKTKIVDKRNNPASPSPAVDDSGIYVFFPDYGLIAYDAAGQERWKMPLGPFDNIYGMGASPVIVGDLLVLACDQSTGSYLLALDKQSGRERWRTPRPEAKSGHSTPIIWRAPDGRDQIVLPGSFLLTAYNPVDGRKIWWVRGLSFEMKSTPVIDGDTLFINGYGAEFNDPGRQVTLPADAEIWANDADANGELSKGEMAKLKLPYLFGLADLSANGAISKEEWNYYRAAMDSENGMLAIRLGGSGDMTEKSVKWKYQRSVPQLPSPIVYRGVLYMVNDGGIVTTLKPDTGELIKQGRLTGALGNYFASPIAADGRLFFLSQPGVVAVLPPGGDLTPIATNNLNEDSYATPAFADGRIYVRTVQALYAFGKS
jgi:outer membrane protein assembly factor BamB